MTDTYNSMKEKSCPSFSICQKNKTDFRTEAGIKLVILLIIKKRLTQLIAKSLLKSELRWVWGRSISEQAVFSHTRNSINYIIVSNEYSNCKLFLPAH